MYFAKVILIQKTKFEISQN